MLLCNWNTFEDAVIAATDTVCLVARKKHILRSNATSDLDITRNTVYNICYFTFCDRN